MISASANAVPAAPPAPAVNQTSAPKTSADGSTFHALFNHAESESKPVESKTSQPKPGGQKNSAGQKKTAPKNLFAGPKTDDSTRTAPVTVAVQPTEILD